MQPLKAAPPVRFDTPAIPREKDMQSFANDRGDGFAANNNALTDKIAQFRSNDPGGLLRIVCKGRLVSLTAGDIEFIKSDANYVEVHAGGLRYRVRSTLKQFQTRLSPANF